MSVPFLNRVTTDVVVELSRSQGPPTLPFELRDHVSPNTWEVRVSALTRLASQYFRPTFERTYLAIVVVLSFLVPITAYYVTLRSLEGVTDDIERQVWFVRLTCFAVMIAMWLVLVMPMLVWKYLGKVRVAKLADLWTKADALSAPCYGAAPVWKATVPGLFKDAVVLVVTVPVTAKSHFDRDSLLPPYIAAGDDGLPPYGDSRVPPWSKDPKGGIRYGDLPIYTL